MSDSEAGTGQKLLVMPKPSDEATELARQIWEYGASVKWGAGRAMFTQLDIAELCDAALRSASARGAAVERERLTKLIDTPHTSDFMEAVPLEAAHQLKRWGVEHDDGKRPQDWFWLVGYLAGKCLRAAIDYEKTGEARHLEKAKHHTISTAAVMLNWFRRMSGDDSTFRPGIAPPPELAGVGFRARSDRKEGDRG